MARLLLLISHIALGKKRKELAERTRSVSPTRSLNLSNTILSSPLSSPSSAALIKSYCSVHPLLIPVSPCANLVILLTASSYACAVFRRRESRNSYFACAREDWRVVKEDWWASMADFRCEGGVVMSSLCGRS